MRNTLLYKSLQYVLGTCKSNIKYIFELAVYTVEMQTLRTSLGIGWVFFRDAVYLAAFTLFRYLMSGSGEVEGLHFVLYLMVALIPWNFMNECINGSVMGIKSNKFILSSMKFPSPILPIVEVLAIFIKRLFTLLILLVMIVIFGDLRDITLWLFIYYFVAMFIFMCIWNILFSPLIAISNDFEQLYKAAMSVLFFTIPVMWSFEIIKNVWIIRLFKLNPFVYIVEGFRDACANGTLPNPEYTLYFFAVNIIMLCVGCVLQYKLENHYIDLI